MKKLLGISIVAMLAVSPMMANATDISGAMYTAPSAADTDHPAPTTSADPAYGRVNISTDDQSHIASTAYVKGAYNSAIAAVNRVAANNTTSAGNGIAKSAAGAFSVNLTKGTGADANTNVSGLKLDGETDGSKTLSVDVDGSTVEINGTSHQIGVVAGGINTTQLADSAVTSGKIATGAVAFAKVASDDIIASTSNSNAGIRATDSASDSKFVTEKAVAQAVEAAKTAVTVSEGAGIDVTNNKVSVDLTSNGGLKMSDNTDAATLGIDTGNGLVIDTTGTDAGKLRVNYTANTGFQNNSSTGALEIKAGNGIATGSDGVVVDLKTSGSGLEFTDGKLGVDVGSTIEVGANGLEVKDGTLTVAKINSSDLAAGTGTYATSTDLAEQGYVDQKVAGLQTGTLATINASTVSIFTTWGSDDGTAQGATTTVSVAAPSDYVEQQQGSL